jgi:hypothetical protein
MSFRCPPILKDRIDALIHAGLYPDFSSFVVAALENQLLLEEVHAPRAEAPPADERGAEEPAAPPQEPPRPPGITPAGESVWRIPPHERTMPEAALATGAGLRGFERDRLGEKPPFPLPGVVPAEWPPEQRVTVDKWLFGQYNRLLPAKVSLRALAVMAADAGDALPLAEVAPRIADLAARFGAHLRALDRRFLTHRDEALATAFPEEGPEGQKGRLRYQNHFVGHSVNGRPGGLPADLCLADISFRKNRPWLAPTPAGWEFARLASPLLDSPVVSPPAARFAPDEVSFLLDHIRHVVPAEWFAYHVVLSLIAQGERTPNLLTRRVGRYLPSGQSLKKQRDFVSTQRTGVLGRAADLGLIRRERQARHITYDLTRRGDAFLEEAGLLTKKK